MTLFLPAGASYKSLGCDLIADLRALCPLSLLTSASSSTLTPSPDQGRWISLYFMPGIPCPVDRRFPGELGQQSPAEEPPQGRQGARWAGTRALISLSLETRCTLSQILSSCLLCPRSPWPQLAPEGRGLSRSPPGARPLPSALPSRGVGTRRAQGNGPRVRRPLPVNYAGGWHRCSSYSSFPGNFRSGIPPAAQRAAPPARPGPQAPSLCRQAAQPWVPGNREGS